MSLQARIEAVIFAAPQPLTAKAIVTVLDDAEVSVEQVDAVCQQLSEHYREREGGFELVKNGGYRFQTVSSAATMLRRLGKSYTRPLSRAALETLAVVAYRQPLTRAEIEYIRGVESGNLVRTLLERELLVCVGRKDSAGKPLLFAVGPRFLQVFGLHDLQELPPLESFQVKDETRQLAEAKIRAQSAPQIDTLIGGKESSAEDREENSDNNNLDKNNSTENSNDDTSTDPHTDIDEETNK